MFTLISRWIPCLPGKWKISVLFLHNTQEPGNPWDLSFITLKFFSVVPATNSHTDTAHSKVPY